MNVSLQKQLLYEIKLVAKIDVIKLSYNLFWNRFVRVGNSVSRTT